MAKKSDGNPKEVKFFDLERTTKNYVKKRDENRKNPQPFALVQHPEVYK